MQLQGAKSATTFALLLLAACGAQVAQHAATTGSPRYPGSCSLVGIDEVSAPSDQASDSVALVARYRFGSGSPAASSGGPSLQFQISRARKHDLRQYLEAHSTVVCRPEAGTDESEVRVEVPPFEGQSGEPVH
jgi:hypothetical protein